MDAAVVQSPWHMKNWCKALKHAHSAFHTCILQCMQLSSAGDSSYGRIDVINNTATNLSSEARSVDTSAFEPH